MRVFVFNVFGPAIPSLDEVCEKLPAGSSIIAFRLSEAPYYMVAFDSPDDIYATWCQHKDNDVPIYLDIHGVILHS
jgi:hypothetical protein